ncbi:MAG: hypothetical protein U1F43_10370 [Myxococcota bacterium]
MTSSSLVLLLAASAIAHGACGDSAGSASDTAASDTSASDATADATTGDSATSVDAGVDLVDGRSAQGVYLCCAPGEARADCCPPDTLPDPEHNRSATCFQYGGVVGACVDEGGQLEAKDICSTCCPGLTRVDSTAPASDGTCQETAPPSVFFCAACGDGTCGTGENRCNCTADCPTN